MTEPTVPPEMTGTGDNENLPTTPNDLVRVPRDSERREMEMLRPRLTGKDMVLYQAPHEPPVAIEVSFVRWLTTREQPWIRRGLATREWQPLQCGWLSDQASLLKLINREGYFRQKQPHPHERALKESLRIELGIHVGGNIQGIITVPVRESCRFTPWQAPANYYVRCPSGQAEYDLRLYPM